MTNYRKNDNSHYRTYRIMQFLKKDFNNIYINKIDYLNQKYKQFKIDKDKTEWNEKNANEIWWNLISLYIPQNEDECKICSKCAEDYKQLLQCKTQELDDFKYSCTPYCLWFDYYWSLFHQDTIYKNQDVSKNEEKIPKKEEKIPKKDEKIPEDLFATSNPNHIEKTKYVKEKKIKQKNKDKLEIINDK